MNREVPFRAVEYGNGDSQEVVALVTGFTGKTAQLEKAALDLVASGRDAILYTYDPRILLAGDAELLPQFIDTVSDHFTSQTTDHARRRYAGASLGGAIAVGMQKKDLAPERGLLAATGIDAAELVMRNQFFRAIVLATHHIDIRRTYEKNGYTLTDLRERWQEVQVPPVTPFTIAIGGLDVVVQHRKISRQLNEWKKENPDIRVVRKCFKDHNGTIKWFNQNIGSLLDQEPITEIIDFLPAA